MLNGYAMKNKQKAISGLMSWLNLTIKIYKVDLFKIKGTRWVGHTASSCSALCRTQWKGLRV